MKSLITLFIAVSMLAGCEAGTAAPASNLVAIGASDVVGVGAQHPASQGWAPVLAGLLPGRVELTRVGESGWQADEIRNLGLEKALSAEAGTIVLWTGVNDLIGGRTLEAFATDLEVILVSLSETGSHVFLVNLPDLHRLPAFRDRAAELKHRTPAWQETVRALGERHGVAVIALSGYADEVEDHPEYLSADGFHPSAVGYRRLAEIIKGAIAS